VQFLIGHFPSSHDTPSDDWSSLRVSLFSFLELFPLMFTKYLFFLFSLFKGTVTIEYEMKIFSHPLAHVSIWKLLRFIGHFVFGLAH
jgi:hypothetical protein